MKISLVIPVKDDQRIMFLIEQFQEMVPEIELLIGCNGSTDGFIAQIKKAVENLNDSHVIVVPKLGPASAINYMAAKAKGDYLIVLDSDCRLADGYFEGILNVNNFDIARGPVVYKGSTFFSRLTAQWRQAVIKRIETQGRIYTPNLIIRRELFQKNRFNENLRYTFDSDFSDRLMNMGYRAELIDSAIVYHDCHTRKRTEFKIWHAYGVGRYHRMRNNWQHLPYLKRYWHLFFGDLPYRQLKNVFLVVYCLMYFSVRISGIIRGMVQKLQKRF